MRRYIKISAWILLCLLLISLLGLIGYFVSINDTTPPTAPSTAQEQLNSDEIAEAISSLIEEDEKQQNEANKASVTATLDSLRDNGNEFGVAVRTFNSVTNQFEIELIATLGDPQSGNEYVSFITDGVSSRRIGSLTKETENTYAISYKNKADIAKLNEIVIIETGTQSEDVLQGFFE